MNVDVTSCAASLASCTEFAAKEYGPGSFYGDTRQPLAVAAMAAWRPSTVARYNARRCERFGYSHRPWIDRAEHERELFEIRSSAEERQGRPMPGAYLQYQRYGHDELDPPCRRHFDIFHGVFDADGRLVAYAHTPQSGDAVRVNTFLGHDAHLDAGVAWLLLLRAFEWHRDEAGALFGIYYTHDSGTPGLRYFKERCGMIPTRLEFS